MDYQWDADDLKLENVIRTYKSYNIELTNIISSINRILENDEITKLDHTIFSEFRSFRMLSVSVDANLENVDHSFVSDLVSNIFTDNIHSVDSLCIIDKGSYSYTRLMRIIVESSLPQSNMINGLNKVIDFYKNIRDVAEFYENTFVLPEKVSSYYYDENSEDTLDSSRFFNSLNHNDSDEVKIDLIRREIRSVKLNCIGPDSLYTTLAVELYTQNLEEYMKVLQQYGDDSIKIKSNTSSQSSINITHNTPEPKFEEPEGTELASTTPRNKNHTVIRKCLAMYYLFNEISPHLFNDGNVKSLARFIQFLTGNSEKNIYDYLRNMHDILDKSTPKVKSDIKFVINELDKINLGVISNKIKRDVEGGMEK